MTAYVLGKPADSSPVEICARKFVTDASRRFMTAVDNSLIITPEDRGIILELFNISQ